VVIVDSSVWVDYLNGIPTVQTDWLDNEVGRQRLGLTDLILCEVLQGIRDDRRFVQVQRELLEFEVFSGNDTDLAIEAGLNYRKLRARGHTVRRTIDCLIATFCLAGGHSLLHSDRDFDLFEKELGLPVIHP
jgi:predicted nucleic acid-binding protein